MGSPAATADGQAVSAEAVPAAGAGRAARFPRMVVIWLVVAELIIIGVTRYASLSLGVNLFSEGTVFTFVSTVQLLAVAGLALAAGYLGVVSPAMPSRTRWRWYGLGVFAGYLAVDEYFYLHERVSRAIESQSIRRLGYDPTLTYLDAPIFLAYAAIAVVIMWGLRRDLAAVPRARGYLLASGVILGSAVFSDLLLTGSVPVMWEDGLKLVGFLFVAAALGSVFRARLEILADPAGRQ